MVVTYGELKLYSTLAHDGCVIAGPDFEVIRLQYAVRFCQAFEVRLGQYGNRCASVY